MSWSKRVKHPSKVLQVGQEVEAVVLDLDGESRRISLGLKQIDPDPWSTLAERYKVDSTITGRVRNLTDFGAFIEVEEGIDGLVHVSDISHRRIKHPSEALKKGDAVEAVILNIDVENHRLSLGIRQREPDAWVTFFDTYKVGDTVKGRVARHAPFGVFVELDEGVEGLCHVSELDDDAREDPESAYKVGDTVEPQDHQTEPRRKEDRVELESHERGRRTAGVESVSRECGRQRDPGGSVSDQGRKRQLANFPIEAYA